uniref:reverse transcriptase domain-containing protein n=1 Tax=Acinetobacter baumannii TaxID=470 RepID=UPI0033966158
AFDSLDRSTLWACLKRNGVPDKYISVIKGLYYQTSGRVKAYGKLSSSFTFSSGVRQGCPMSPFLFNFVMINILGDALEGITNNGVELLPGD